jgi:hypothetical protein
LRQKQAEKFNFIGRASGKIYLTKATFFILVEYREAAL